MADKVSGAVDIMASSDKWKTIESAPRDGSFVLLYVPRGLESGLVTMGSYFWADERDERGRFKKGEWYLADWQGWLGIDGDNLPSWCDPTHWRPMPQPPICNASDPEIATPLQHLDDREP